MGRKHCGEKRNCLLHNGFNIYFIIWVTYPFPKPQISNASKLKEFADDNFKLNENGRKFPKWVENTVRKREIARYTMVSIFIL